MIVETLIQEIREKPINFELAIPPEDLKEAIKKIEDLIDRLLGYKEDKSPST